MAVRARVYEIGDKKLGYLYAYQHGPLVKRRLLQAGIRLAGVLNALFDSPAPSIPDQLPSRYRRLSLTSHDSRRFQLGTVAAGRAG
jgi:hypothetical protein